MKIVAVAMAIFAILAVVTEAKPQKKGYEEDVANIEAEYEEFLNKLDEFLEDRATMFNEGAAERGMEKRVSTDWTEWLVFVADLLEFIADNQDLFEGMMYLFTTDERSLETMINQVEQRHEVNENLAERAAPFPDHIRNLLKKKLATAARASDDNKEWTNYMEEIAQMINVLSTAGKLSSRDEETHKRVARSADDKISGESLQEFTRCILNNPKLLEDAKKMMHADKAAISDAKRASGLDGADVAETEDAVALQARGAAWAEIHARKAEVLKESNLDTRDEQENARASEDDNKDWTDYMNQIAQMLQLVSTSGKMFSRDEQERQVARGSDDDNKDWTDYMNQIAQMLQMVSTSGKLFSRDEQERQVARGSDDDNKDWTDYMNQIAQMMQLISSSGKMFSRDEESTKRVARSVDGQITGETFQEIKRCVVSNPKLYEQVKRLVRNLEDARKADIVRESGLGAREEQMELAARLEMTWADYLYMIAGILRMIATGGNIFD